MSQREINVANCYNAARRELGWPVRRCPPKLLAMIIEDVMEADATADTNVHVLRATRSVRRRYRQEHGFTLYLFVLGTIISMVWQWWLNRRK